MHTNSLFLRKLVAALGVLNRFYEASVLFRAVEAVKRVAGNSAALGGFARVQARDYWAGSRLCGAAGAILRGATAVLGWCVGIFFRLNESSMNRRAFAWVRMRSRSSFIAKAVRGCVPYRLCAWFFGDAHAAVAPHKIVYMLFLCGVLLVPGHLWRNVILLAGAGAFALFFALRAAWEAQLRRQQSAPLYISPALLLFVGFCALSIFTGYGESDSARVFGIFFACVVHSILVAHMLQTRADVRLFCKLAAVTIALLALFGFYQLALGIPIRPDMTDLLASPGLVRLHSTLGNPNNDAQAWGMLLPFTLAILVAARCDSKRVLIAGAVAVCMAAFALTYSRAGYVAAMAGVGVFVLMSAPRLVPIALIAGLLMLPLVPDTVIARLLTLGTDESSLYRFNIWRGVLNMLRVYWVQGIGMGPVAFAETYARHYHGEAWRALHAHNTFLDIFVHSGIGALTAFLAYIFGLLKRGIAAHMNAPDKEIKMFTAAAVTSVAVFLAFGVGEYVWFYPRVMLVSWISFGVLSAMPRIVR